MRTERIARRRWARVLAAAATLLLLGGGAAQGQQFTGVAGGYFETYEFLDPEVLGIQRVSLVTVPIGVQAPIIERVSVELRSAFAYGSGWR